MTKAQDNVRQFMKTFGQEVPDKPKVASIGTRLLRVKLLLEEVIELADASGVAIELGVDAKAGDRVTLSSNLQLRTYDVVDLVGIADALADIDYVNQGAAIAYGLDLEPFSDEVHSSNMTKLWTKAEVDAGLEAGATSEAVEGTDRFIVRRSDGKIIKSPSYRKADLVGVLAGQITGK